MSSVTLAESAKLCQDELLAGVIENVVTVNPFFEVLPFRQVEGNALAYNRENALGDVEMLAVGGTITAKAPATFTPITQPFTTIIGDAEVNGLIQATRSNKNDQRAVQIASKAKSLARKFQDQLINGNGTPPNLPGLLSLVAGGQTITAGVNGAALSFALLDQMLELVISKDGEVDFILMHARTIRSYKSLLRALGGASVTEVMEMPSGRKVISYEGIPIFRCDWIPTNQVEGSSGAVCTSIIAGTLDGGEGKHGLSGFTPPTAAGIQVEPVGVAETKDETIDRVKWYCGIANYSTLGLSLLKGVNN